MDIVPTTYIENLKRYWRRRRYQRVDESSCNKKRLKITRLGNKIRFVWKIKLVPKQRFKYVSPFKLMAKFHDAYVETMIRLVGEKKVGLFGGKRSSKSRPLPIIFPNDEIVDGRLILEIYNRMVSSSELSALLV